MAWDSWKNIKISNADVEIESKKLWKEAGEPQGKDLEFWSKAEINVKKRIALETGITGCCCNTYEEAKGVAIKQFLRRKQHAIKTKKLNSVNGKDFYCDHCKIHIETLPLDYLFEIRKICSQCKALLDYGWLHAAFEHYDYVYDYD